MSDEIIETWFDQPLLFTIAARHVRGRLVRLGPTLNTIMAAHNYPPVAEKLLGEALVLTVAARFDAQGRERPDDVAGADRRRDRSNCWCAIIAAASCAAT